MTVKTYFNLPGWKRKFCSCFSGPVSFDLSGIWWSWFFPPSRTFLLTWFPSSLLFVLYPSFWLLFCFCALNPSPSAVSWGLVPRILFASQSPFATLIKFIGTDGLSYHQPIYSSVISKSPFLFQISLLITRLTPPIITWMIPNNVSCPQLTSWQPWFPFICTKPLWGQYYFFF